MRLLDHLKRAFKQTRLSPKALQFARRRPRRLPRFEILEARQLLAAAVWHNILQPLNVSGETGGSVDPLDVLSIVNEINNPRFSDPLTGVLPLELPASQSHPFFDTDCDSRVGPLDVLIVINAINLGSHAPDWVFTGSNQSSVTCGRVTNEKCSPKLIEGDSLYTDLSQTIVLPDNSSAIRVSFESPVFDTLSQNTIRDAFEILLLDQNGQLLTLPFETKRDASYNWSERIDPVSGVGTQITTLPSGSISTATFNLVGLADGTKVEVKARLVNNDSDTQSSVIIRRVEIIDSQTPAPTGMAVTSSSIAFLETLDPSLLTDVTTSMLPIYGRTTLYNGNDVLVTDLQLSNQGNTAVSGRILVAIDNLSDPAIGVLHPDGFLPGGRPYVVLSGVNGNAWLAKGEITAKRELRFNNPSHEKFDYSLTVLAERNSMPTGFVSEPLLAIEAGKTYASLARAIDPDGQPITYSIAAGPPAMKIGASTGQISWSTSVADVGNQSVVLRATDPYGLSVEQVFTITVFESLQNRPPIITSTPVTEAKVAGVFEVTTLKVGNDPIGIAAADFGRGQFSVVTANAGDADLTVSSNESGVFTPSSANLGELKPDGRLFRGGANVNVGLPALQHIYDYNELDGLVQADFNGDGNVDFATSNYQHVTLADNAYEHYLAVVLSHGDGTFAEPLKLLFPAHPNSEDTFANVNIIASDFDGDGKLDLLANSYHQYNVSTENRLSFWHGNGDGTFGSLKRQDSVVAIGRMVPGDFNADGKLDLLVTPAEFTRSGIMLGNGDGTFGAYAEFVNNPAARYYAVGTAIDLDGKNGLDVVLGNFEQTQLEVYLNDGTGKLTQSVILPTYEPFNIYGPDTSVTRRSSLSWVGDFTGDGNLDIVYATENRYNAGSALGIWKGTGDGTTFAFAAAAQGFANNPVNYATHVPVDLNGDGTLDLVFGHENGYFGVAVALGKGDGTFAIQVSQTASDASSTTANSTAEYYLQTGDYNRDGVQDIAVVNSRRGGGAPPMAGLTVLFGETPGQVVAPRDFVGPNMGNSGQLVNLLGDINNDGNLDMVVGDGARFYTRLGNGDGTFQSFQVATPGFYANDPHDAFLTDLNHDGTLDLVWSRIQFYQGANQGMMAALGNGDGTFTVTFNTPAPNFYGAAVMIPGDFNNDGYTDFAAGGGGAFAGGSFIDVWLYDSSNPGTFQQKYRYILPVDAQSQTLVTKDFDGDGILDFVSFQPYRINDSSRQLLFFKGNGDGSFMDPTFTPVFKVNSDIGNGGGNWNPGWTAAGDLNEDGNMDFVVTSSYSRSVTFLGNGDGTFQANLEYQTGTYFASNRQAYLQDLDRDAHLDLVTIDDNQSRRVIAVRRGKGDGTFGPEERYNTGNESVYLAFGDVDNDGVTDLLNSSPSYGFSYSTLFAGASPGLTGVTTGDVNGDGHNDSIAISSFNSRVKILIGKGNDTFTRQHDLIVGRNPVAVAALDIDGDNATDIVTANQAGRSVSVLKNDGSGKFTRNDISIGKLLTAMAVGNVTGDSRVDVVVASEQSKALFVLVNNGNGFGAPVALPLGDQPGEIAIGDVTTDGFSDIVVSLPQSKRLMVLPGDGSGSFGVPQYVQLANAAGSIGIADFNQDGKNDIALTLPDQNQAAILFSRGGGRFARPQSINVGANPKSLSIQDMNADGLFDILVANAGDSTASVIINRYDSSKLYRYSVTASDPDGDPVTFELTNGPGGMIFDDAGQMVWAPTADQIGLNAVTVTASDGNGGSATQSFNIAVASARENASPVIFSTAPERLDATKSYSYIPTAIDPNGDTLRYRLISGPDGATIDPTSGEVKWDPRGGGLNLNKTQSTAGFVTVPMSPSIMAPSLTLEGYFRLDKANTNQSFFRKQSYAPYPSSVYTFSLSYYFGQLYAYVGGIDADGKTDNESVAKPWNYTAGDWHHLAMTFDDATGLLSVYVDGNLFVQKVTSRHLVYDNQEMSIGYGYFDPLVGNAAQVRMWNFAKSEQQLRAGFLVNFAADTPGLVLDYRFNDGDVLTIRDHTQYGNNGHLANGYGGYSTPSIGLGDAQTQYFAIQVEDGRGGVSLQNFGVNVVPPQTRAIVGTVFSDDDNSGAQNNAEVSFAGAVVYIDANGNDVRDATEIFAVTDSIGRFEIASQLTGTYAVGVEPRAGYEKAYVQFAHVDAFTDSNISFGLIPKRGDSIRGGVLIDTNGNGAPNDAEIVYASDFDSTLPNLSMWSNRTITASPSGAKLLGEFVNDVVMLTLGSVSEPLKPHDTLTVSFDLHLLKGWYGNYMYSANHPEQWAIEANGQEVFRTTFSNYPGYSQSYPQATGASNPARTGSTNVNTLGYAADSTYHLSFTIATTAPTATFTFRGIDLNVSDQPTWAMSNVTVKATEPPATHWPVYLDTNNNKIRDPGEPLAITDAVGHFAFAGLYSNDWHVRLDSPAGWATTTPVSGQYDIALPSNGTSTGNNFVLRASEDAASLPRFITVPQSYASARAPYRFVNVAVDPGYRPLTYSLASGPDEMHLDPATGTIVWVPTLDQVGDHRVILKVVNDRGGIALQDFNITVEKPNSLPIITSTPLNTAAVDQIFRYDLLAQDAEQPTLEYKLQTGPTGATIDTHGRVNWAPNVGQLGTQPFAIQVSDGQGGEVTQVFTINVVASSTNHAPTFIGNIRGHASVGLPYFANLTAVDMDHDGLTFGLLSGPDGMQVDGDGMLSWTPTSIQFGSKALRVRVSDGHGGVTERDLTIEVQSTFSNRNPMITSQGGVFAVAGNEYRYDLAARDLDDDPVAFQIVTGPAGLSIDPLRGTVRWVPGSDQFGQSTVTLRAVDSFGGSAEQSFNISVRSVGGPPAITSVPPTQTSVGTAYLYSVLANDSELDPFTFSLLEKPVGMTISAITGEISWTPTAGQLGLSKVIIQVSDGVGGFATQAFSIQVAAGAINQPPIITDAAPIYASVGAQLSYQIVAIDPEGAAIHYQLRRGPNGISVNVSTGQVSWTPVLSDIGTQIIAFAAFDAQGAAAVLSFEIEVLAANIPPGIQSLPPTKATARGMFRYDVIATDTNLDPLKFTLLNSPAGMTVDAFGRIRWQTDVSNVGNHSALLRVSDPRGGSVEQLIVFAVVPDTQAPRVTVIPGQNIVRANSAEVFIRFNLSPIYPTNTVRVSAVDDVGVTSLEVTANGKPISLDVNGLAVFNFKDWGFGTVQVVARAKDAADNLGTGTKAFAFLPYGDDPAVAELAHPEAVITSPAASESVLGVVKIIGSASSDNFTSFTLSYRRGDSSNYTVINTGTAKVQKGLLGEWDTTLLENDEYFLLLEVQDEIFGTTAYEQSVGVRGEFKLGNFRLSFTDITIPVAGIPITLTRTYDTLRADRNSDFGFGWRMEFRNADLRTSVGKTGLEDFGIYKAFKPGTKVFLTLPGGSREGFTFTPNILFLPGFGGGGLRVAQPHFTSDRGVKSSLSVAGGYLILNDVDELMASGGIPWNPASPDFGGGYTVTELDGTQYQIDGASGYITRVKDTLNNNLIFTDNGIESDSGTRINILRDSLGRITQIVGPMGESVAYTYDSRSNLVSVSDAIGNKTEMGYSVLRPHYLNKIVDPLGRPFLRLEYDDSGRIIATVDAQGHRTAIVHDVGNLIQTVTDALGNVTILGLDAQGNVKSTVDPAGHITLRTFDADNNLLSKTNALGNRVSYVYDSRGLQIEETDAKGFVTRYDYNSFGSPTSSVDHLGNTTKIKYTNSGTPTSLIEPTGFSYDSHYDAHGNMVGFVGGVDIGTAAYDRNGNLLTQSESEFGYARALDYDASGNVKTEIIKKDGQDFAITYEYDAKGRIVKINRWDGVSQSFGFDANGNIVRATDFLGNVTRYVYDSLDRLIKTIYPDSTPENNDDNPMATVEYNAVGQVVAQIDEVGNRVSFQYDSVGNRVATIFPDKTPETLDDNPRQISVYDAIGQLIASVDELGNTTQYEYDTVGHPTLIRDALGSETATAYDAEGNVTTVKDPLGRQLRYVYDKYGRRTEVIYPDGSKKSLTLNADSSANAVSDSLGSEFHVESDARGRISKIVDFAGGEALYQYDPMGNLVSQTDPNGNLSKFEFDVLGRQTKALLPLGQEERRSYDALGRVKSVVDYNGNESSYSYDARGNLVRVTYQDGSTVAYKYSANGLLTSAVDPAGTTTLEYDQRNRLISRTDDFGRKIEYAYDAASNLVSIKTPNQSLAYAYDALGRITKVVEGNNQAAAYTYDLVGNLVSIQLENGASQSRSYDQINRLLQIEDKFADGTKVDKYYEYDANGRLLKIVGTGGFVQQFSYDPLGRLTAETLINSTGAALVSATYNYDASGNRLKKASSDLGVVEYVQDKNNRLISVTNSEGTRVYTYDANGNLLQLKLNNIVERNYTWDLRGRLVGVDSDGNGTNDQTKVYDYAGNLIAEVTNETNEYLVDINRSFSQIIEEYKAGNNTATVETVYGITVIKQTREGVSSFYHQNHQGSTTALSNAIGNLSATYTYDAFGEIKDQSGVAANTLLYDGERLDPVTGLYFLRSRYFDPSVGRFDSQDAFTGQRSFTQSLNRYTFVHNDPTNLTDPSGFAPETLAELTVVQGLQQLATKATGVYSAYKAVSKSLDGLVTTVLLVKTGVQFALAVWGLEKLDTRFVSTKITLVNVKNPVKVGWVKQVGVSYSPKGFDLRKGSFSFDFEFPGDGGLKVAFKIKLSPFNLDEFSFGGEKEFVEFPEVGEFKGAFFKGVTKASVAVGTSQLSGKKFPVSAGFGFTVLTAFKFDLKVFPEILEYFGVLPDPNHK